MARTAVISWALPTPYEQHRDYVLGVLGRRCGWLDTGEREEAFHDAYAVLLEKERNGAIDLGALAERQVRAFLTQTAIHKGLDEGKRVGRRGAVPLEEADGVAADDGHLPEDLAAAGIESARIRELVAELPARRQAIVKLRCYFDRTPSEIQRLLGITERVYRRELERSIRHLSDRYELVRSGALCTDRRSAFRAVVTGVAGPGRARIARDHLAICPSCTRWAAGLRATAPASEAPPATKQDRRAPRPQASRRLRSLRRLRRPSSRGVRRRSSRGQPPPRRGPTQAPAASPRPARPPANSQRTPSRAPPWVVGRHAPAPLPGAAPSRRT